MAPIPSPGSSSASTSPAAPSGACRPRSPSCRGFRCKRLLFTSDLHALRPAFELFARTLASGPFDAGVIAGDLLDDLSDAEDEGPRDRVGQRVREINLHGLSLVVEGLAELLAAAGKPVFLVPGNHDEAPWPEPGLVRNLDRRRVDHEGWNFVGLRETVGWSFAEGTTGEEEMKAALEGLCGLVDGRTILVTHSPPAGVLDVEHGHVHASFGRRGRSLNGAYPASLAFWDLDIKNGRSRALPARVEMRDPSWS